MESCYALENTDTIVSPALVVFAELVDQNLDEMLRIAGRPGRLRPHCKTHKMPDVIRLMVARGIDQHKCATLAEAEMLASAGARDILLAYNPVGPNLARCVRFVREFAGSRLSVTADHPGPVAALGRAMAAAGLAIDVLVDIDTGQHRTGVGAGPPAEQLAATIASTPGLEFGGLHVYDGHNHQTDYAERQAAVMACWRPVEVLVERLRRAGTSPRRIVAGGTGSFPVFAELDVEGLELSPGTCVFFDAGYRDQFPDLHFRPAALVLTRVVSRPTERRVTFDLGYKACASDPPAGRRLEFPGIPDADAVLQNEEHLVVETDLADRFQPGDEQWAIPRHICPTSALHKYAHVVRGGRLVGRWEVTARDRELTI